MSKTHSSTIRVSQLLGNDNVTVNYADAFLPYYDKLAKACEANSTSFVPTSICIGTRRLGLEFYPRTHTLRFTPLSPLPVKKVRGPADHIHLPVSYRFPGLDVVTSFLQPLFPDIRRMITYMWLIGNAAVDPVARPRCMMLVGPGGAGRSTALRMVAGALAGSTGLLPDNVLTKSYEGLGDRVARTVIKSRMVNCFELDLVRGRMNMSIFKNITGSDHIRVGELSSKATCSLAIATNGLPDVILDPEFCSDQISRRLVCIKMDVDTAEAPYAPDPSSARDKVDFLCACVYTRMRFAHLPIMPDDLLITLCDSLYFEVAKVVREERTRPVTYLEGTAVLAILAGALRTDASNIVNRSRLISMSCVEKVGSGYLLKGLVPYGLEI